MRRSVLTLFACVLFCSATFAADTPSVDFKADGAGPRAVESMTQRSVPRDYANAWRELTFALEQSAPQLLDSHFTGAAKANFAAAIEGQKRSGLRSRYLDQKHKLDVTFYAPEGDVMELRDTVECQFQVLDGNTVVHDEHVVLRYIVLMTPAADKWQVRLLQAVPEF